jgi:hypothetical protein
VKRITCAALFLAACGPSPVLYTEVDAPFVVPDDCDTLAVEIARADGGLAFDASYALSAPQQFPLEQLFDADPADLGIPLEVTVTALKGGAKVADGGSESLPATLAGGQLVRLLFTLQRP